MSDDPQERVGRGQWFSHDGPIWIDTLGAETVYIKKGENS